MHDSLPEQSQTPFDEQRYRLFQQLVSSLTPEQKAWMAGYLTAQLTSTSHSAGAMTQAEEITILVGSQTGNSEALAEQTQALARERGLRAVIKDMGDYKAPQLKTEKFLLVIVSTYGEGEPPDNARELYEFLFSKRAPSLKNTQFAVLALGDSSYEFFCKTGADFDRRLEELGAARLHERVDCDVDYETAAEGWINAVLEDLSQRTQSAPSATAQPASPLSSAGTSPYSRKHPFPAVLLEDIVLNGRGSQKETHHYELSLEGSGLHYEPGDALGVYPCNAPEMVDELLKKLHFNGEEKIDNDGKDSTLSEALLRNYEITTPTRPMLQKYAALINNAELARLLDEAHKQALADYLYGREIIDVVTDFPGGELNPQDFIGCLRKLPPRLYSIASSLKQHPDEVHLTVAAVRYQSHGRRRHGVCSTFLADRLGPDSTIPVYVDHNKNFKLPTDPDTPIIMIGPGTGIAPFRAFVEEREAIGASGKNWLFFGDQHFMTDYLYQSEWLRYLKSGLLTRMNVAFSRDQAEKVYVQQRMRENGRDLYAWLQEGAYLYVCGDEKHMARDVHETLLGLVEREGGMSREAAEQYVKTLQKEKRYQRDVY
ncbi:assimilatory sulfite reductase (NADPH) flavoprotein subunit [Methylomarinum vadi]|uniref:assimilatory sulfite reductase (NADPH) flavoprotein subunit n=1 Tax=Methylomarinum vadi TaxID=438855 RepID=UPI0004DF55C8|nr:assimilatory sulfite reductase (NADPH) flavoprotein subunit [Methylomarinum vadi]